MKGETVLREGGVSFAVSQLLTAAIPGANTFNTFRPHIQVYASCLGLSSWAKSFAISKMQAQKTRLGTVFAKPLRCSFCLFWSKTQRHILPTLDSFIDRRKKEVTTSSSWNVVHFRRSRFNLLQEKKWCFGRNQSPCSLSASWKKRWQKKAKKENYL